MPHTFSQQYIHIVFGTHDCKPLISERARSDLYAYMTGILKELGGSLLDRSGTENHLHLLVNAPTDRSVSEILNAIKSNSSKWYRARGLENKNFAWSEGYAAFTVSPDSIEKVVQYFSNEAERHLSITFETELSNFLQMHEIQFKPQFVTKTTYTQLLYHLVWSVKHRECILNQSLKPLLSEKIQKEIEEIRGKLIAVGNVSDHIHLLVECPQSKSIAAVVQRLKTSTTPLINKSLNMRTGEFHWQEGFGIFSVGRPALKNVTNYVINQEEHHRTISFEEEWKAMVARNLSR
jgi:putative transposase